MTKVVPEPLALSVGHSTLVVGHRDIVTVPAEVIVSSEDNRKSVV
jgi:hypothetical protein